MTGSESGISICLSVRKRLAASTFPSRMEMKSNVAAAEREIVKVVGELKANRMIASKPAERKNEALGIIIIHPSKEWQAESPFLCLSKHYNYELIVPRMVEMWL
jgi:hypothetical protein